MAIQLINGSAFIENALAWRLTAIEGRLGSGKTLLSVALAKWLYDQSLVDGVFANFPIDPTYIPIRSEIRRSAVILDEGWAFADSRNSSKKFEGYGAYARKLDSFWFSPSVFRVDKRMGPLRARRLLDLWLFDVWLFEWEDVQGFKGKFLLRNYKEVYGRYDTKFIPYDDGGIKEQMLDEIKHSAGSTSRLFVVNQSKVETVR